MAIDKMIPRFLVSDEDERLLKEGAMTDALNVSISEDGDGSEGVVKNMKGTIAGTAITGSELTAINDVTVIGQVSDPQRSKIYFFVSDDDGHTQDAIYQYDTNEDEYKVVFKNTWLNFESDKFVKADVLNGAFQQDGLIQTILYFTDNFNAPRKINVDRAIEGDYNSLNSYKLDYALKSIKAAQVTPPSFFFTTDSSITENNLTRSAFQFSTQLIYKDGEESAISSYSKLAYSASVGQYGIEDSSIRTIVGNIENTCNIDLNWSNNAVSSNYISDVIKIRLLGREGNSGSFFVIDEFDPSLNLTRSVHGVSTQIYDSSTGVYKFYNEGVYSYVDTNTVNKLYDNVPKLSQGQAISGNRLMYSNYTEGFENNPVNASISVSYSPAVENVFAEPENGYNAISVFAGVPSLGKVDINLLNSDATWPGSNAYNSLIPAGTFIRTAFKYSPFGTFHNSAGTALTLSCTTASGAFDVKLGYGTGSGVLPIALDDDISQIDVSIETTTAMTVKAASEALRLRFIELAIVRLYEFEAVNTSANLGQAIITGQILNSTDGNFPNGNSLTISTGTTVNYSYSFDEVEDTTPTNDAIIRINPYLTSYSFDFSTATSSGQFFDGINGVTGVTQSFSTSDEYSDLTYDINVVNSGGWNGSSLSPNGNYIVDPIFYANSARPVTTFKHGCDHDFGIVYYDKYNRSGNVNKIGSATVDFIGDKAKRNSGSPGREGVATVGVSIPATDSPPPWAVKWQLVYGGMSTYEDVFSYTTGGGYVARDVSGTSNPHPVKTGSKQVYLSLKTLDLHQKEKSVFKNYSYTEGDKLRVISYKDSLGNRVYPMDNNSQSPSPIEFDITSSVVFSSDHDSNIIHDDGSSGHEVEDKYIGTFLVLDCPSVNSGKQVDADNNGNVDDDLKYTGFDWFSLTGNNYPSDANNTETNYWGNECVVEILTPRKNTSDRVYYEIGESQQANAYIGVPPINQHGSTLFTTQGDVRFRLTPCKTPVYSAPNWNVGVPADWEYKTIFLESPSVSEAFQSKDWSKGRAHAVFERSSEVRRFNGVTYSDAYAEDVANLSLSSFNPSLGNFDSLESKFGAINYIGNYNDNLVALQENKLSLIPVGKNIIQYAEGSGNVAISTKVLNPPRYASGDYGCGGHPEAVLIQDNDVFFVDESRQAVMRLGGEQLAPISEKNMSSFFEDFFKAGHAKYVSGYDPRISTYFITGYGGTVDGYEPQTVGYDVARGAWQSRYSFTPDVYANQNNMLYSAKYVGTDAFWRHDDDATPNRNTFHGSGVVEPSEVEMVSKTSPSRVKVYNAVSYEGDSDAWDMNPVSTDLDQTSGTITSWSEKEGSYYAAMPRDTSGNSTSQEIFLGSLTDTGNGLTFTSTIRLSRQNIPLGSQTITQPAPSDPITLNIDSVSGNTITFSEGATGTVGDTYLVLDSATNGDQIRGHYAKIKLTNSSSAKHELYCINTHITDSKSHHPLGQQ